MVNSVHVLALLTLLILALACTSPGPTATQKPEIAPNPTATFTPVPTPTATPTPFVPPTATPEPREIPILTPVPLTPIEIVPGEVLTWKSVMEHLYPHEQECVEDVEGTLEIAVLPFNLGVSHEDAARFACLERATARSLMAASLLYQFQESEDVRVPEDEANCLKGLVFGFNIAQVVAALVPDATEQMPAGIFLTEVFQCAPSALFPVTISQNENERRQSLDCVQRVIQGLRPEMVVAMLNDEGSPEIDAFGEDLWECGNFGYFASTEESTDEPVPPCPDRDDHSDGLEDATTIAAGDKIRGELECRGDIDYFKIEVAIDTVYRVTVDLDTLGNSHLTIRRPDLSEVTRNDDYDGLLASQVVWESMSSGAHYIKVDGYGTGTYILSVESWQDDHGDSKYRATPLQVGEWVKAYIDTEQDQDWFVFEAEKGTRYLIETAVGDADGTMLTLMSEYGVIREPRYSPWTDEPDIIYDWAPSVSGTYNAAVKGRGLGSYHIVIWSRVEP